MRRPAAHLETLPVVSCLFALLLLPACSQSGRGGRSPGGQQAAPEMAPVKSSQSDGAERVEIRFDVLRVQLPFGAVSSSETIWNHVDEDVLDFETARQLGQNGFRVGLASTGSWAPIKAFVDTTAGAATISNAVQTQSLSPVEVQLKEVPEPVTMFGYRRDHSLAGATYPAGMLQLRIEPIISPDRLPEVTLRVEPELYVEPEAVRWQVTPAGPRQTPVRRGATFDALAFSVAVPPGRFLVIGPSRRVSDRRLVGAAFLTDEVEGQLREWMVFVTPSVVRATAPR